MRAVITGLVVMTGMTVFESTKQLILPHITIWHSHFLTIATTTVASLLAYRAASREINAAREIQAVVENALDAMITADEHAHIITWNLRATAMFGWSREEALGKSIVNLIVPQNLRSYYEEEFRNFQIAGESPTINKIVEWPALHKDGHEFPIELATSSAPTERGYGFSMIMRDITERQRMKQIIIDTREEALAASRAKSEFLSTMSHEIRTPMNAILGMTELLAETELQADQRHYLDVMSANGDALLNLINSILDLARIESGRLQIEKTEFDLSDLIDQTISTFGVSAHGKGLELAARIAPGVPDRLIGDPLRLRQILVNLLGNAIKFTELGQVVLEVDIMRQRKRPASCSSPSPTPASVFRRTSFSRSSRASPRWTHPLPASMAAAAWDSPSRSGWSP
jgi:two-component system, sensor histidine kinase and response regulator